MNTELKIVAKQADIKVHHVDPMMLPFVWDECKKHLQKACDRSHGDVTLPGIYSRLMSGDNLLVITRDGTEVIAACTLQVQTNDSGTKYLYIPCVAGDRMDEWMDQFIVVAMAIAKDMGCSQLRGMSVRKGWLRKLNSNGYNWMSLHDVVMCELGE